MKIAIRMDDITADMNWKNFLALKELFDRHGICPLIGVVPDNRDENLRMDPPREDFWEYLGKLRGQGWVIAQHGQYLSLIHISILLVVAVLVRIKLGSPVLFHQERPGKDEKIFTLCKFRTVTDKRDAQGNLLPDAKRLTKFGKMLRATSLDELPELFNIWKGDMSIIGPRPLLVSYLPWYTPVSYTHLDRHRLRVSRLFVRLVYHYQKAGESAGSHRLQLADVRDHVYRRYADADGGACGRVHRQDVYLYEQLSLIHI